MCIELFNFEVNLLYKKELLKELRHILKEYFCKILLRVEKIVVRCGNSRTFSRRSKGLTMNWISFGVSSGYSLKYRQIQMMLMLCSHKFMIYAKLYIINNPDKVSI